MKKIPFVAMVMLLTIAAFNSQAKASGMGFYTNFSYVDVYVENSNSDNYFLGGGFVYDTNVASDNLFNYRLNVGFCWVAIQPDPDYRDLVDIPGGVSFEIFNDFGFGIVRTSNLRLWLGPQIGFRYVNIDTRIEGNSYYGESDFDIDRYIFTVGPVIGLNLNLETLLTLGIDGGFRYNIGYTYGRFASDYEYYETDSYTSQGFEGFVNLSFIFRINE